MANMFDENGNYNKTEWKPGDRITAGKLNKIEESLEAINNNDIERHKEADERLDALEEQNEAVEERFDELEDLVADNKSEVDTAIYEVHSKMDRLETKLDDGIDTVEAIAHTVDDKIADADASMKAQVAEAEDIVDQGKADMEAMVAEVEADLEGLHAKDVELSEQLAHNTIKISLLDQLKCRYIYNIKGDGTNETDKIQKWIDDSSPGDVLYFPKGNYVFDYLEIFNKPNLSIIGADFKSAYNLNNFSTKFTSSFNTKPRIYVKNSVGFRLENVELKSKDALNTTEMKDYGSGIYLQSSGQSIIQNCFIAGFNKGVEILDSGILKIDRNHITHCCYGIYGKECGDSQYTDNYIYDVGFDFDEHDLKADVEFGCGICLSWAGNSRITGGKIEWNAKGILLRDTHGVIIDGVTFDYNRGFDIALDRTLNDYTWEKNRMREHIQTDGKYNTYDIKIVNNTFLSSGHFGDFSDNYYGANISLFETNNIVISSNSFSFGSYQAFANEFGFIPIRETGTEPIRQKSGAKVAFIRLRKAPQTIVCNNTFNSHFNTIPVTINDVNNSISSCLYNNNLTNNKVTTNMSINQFYKNDIEGRKEYFIGDTLPSSLKGSFSYMEKLDFFDGNTIVNKYCTQSGTVRNITTVNGSNDVNNLSVLYCSREISEDDFLIGDYIMVEGMVRRITGFYKPKDGGNHYIKVNSPFDYPVNGEITFPIPTFN